MAVSGDSFADRLDALFHSVPNPETGKQYSVRHVATACGLSHTHLNKLRSGLASDPRRSEMESLARFFGVPLGYFTGDDGAARLSVALGNADVEKVALRMIEHQLSPAGIAAVVAIIDQVARLEAAQRDAAGAGGDGPVQ